MTIKERMKAPTPPFFKRLGLIGKILIGVGAAVGSLATGGLVLPIWMIAGAASVGSVGLTMTAVSQCAVDEEAPVAKP